MSTLNDRIQSVVTFTGLSKTGFGKEINLSQSMVSKLCSGAATPSDRTISDICRVFNVNEEWLLTGEGEMIDYSGKESEIRAIFAQVASLNLEECERLIKALARVPDHMLPSLADRFEQLVDEYKATLTEKDPDTNNDQGE